MKTLLAWKALCRSSHLTQPYNIHFFSFFAGNTNKTFPMRILSPDLYNNNNRLTITLFRCIVIVICHQVCRCFPLFVEFSISWNCVGLQLDYIAIKCVAHGSQLKLSRPEFARHMQLRCISNKNICMHFTICWQVHTPYAMRCHAIVCMLRKLKTFSVSLGGEMVRFSYVRQGILSLRFFVQTHKMVVKLENEYHAAFGLRSKFFCCCFNGIRASVPKTVIVYVLHDRYTWFCLENEQCTPNECQ